MKKRLDVLLVERGLAPSRQRAQAFILGGLVLVNDRPSTKAGTRFEEDIPIRLKGPDHPFVSRGGLKLQAAISAFNPPIDGVVAADLGASTGGFTDCLLQHGVAKVYAIDVGYGQLAWKIRQDNRVVVMERTNARHLSHLDEPVDLVVGDLSFISLSLVLPAISNIAKKSADCLLLVKPQFQKSGRDSIAKGDWFKTKRHAKRLLKRSWVMHSAKGFETLGYIQSPIVGAKSGNIEYLVHLRTPC